MLNKQNCESNFRENFGKNSKISAEGMATLVDECRSGLSFAMAFFSYYFDGKERNNIAIYTKGYTDSMIVTTEWYLGDKDIYSFEDVFEMILHLEEESQLLIKKYNLKKK